MAKAFGMEAENIYLHNCYAGGGFGRRDVADEVIQAVTIAKAVQKPVKLIWSREEDTRHDWLRPMAVVRFKAATGADGVPTALSARTVTGSVVKAALGKLPPNGLDFVSIQGLATNGYNIPNMLIESIVKDTHLPVWWWRAPGQNQNVFAIEGFIDEIAAASNIDPVEMRRKLLQGKPDWLAVLNTAVEQSDWGKPLPKSSDRGVALGNDTDSLCAQVAEVTVSPERRARRSIASPSRSTRAIR